MSSKKEFWIFASLADGGKLDKSVFSMVSKTRAILPKDDRWEICGVVMGDGVDAAAAELSEYVEKVYCVSDPALKALDHMVYADILTQMVKESKPDIVFFDVSCFNSVLAAAAGEKLRTGVIAHAIDVRMDDNDCIVGVIPAFGGKFMGDITIPGGKVQLIGARVSGDDPSKLANKGQVVKPSVKMPAAPAYKFLGVSTPKIEGKPIESAEFIVCGGAGIGSSEIWDQMKEVAGILGAEVAHTRPVVDEGWVDSEKSMIGISGKYVRPKVYLGFGVSGSTHHTCGMRDSKVIINVNTDKNALSMQNSDYIIESSAEDMLKAIKAALA